MKNENFGNMNFESLKTYITKYSKHALFPALINAWLGIANTMCKEGWPTNSIELLLSVCFV